MACGTLAALASIAMNGASHAGPPPADACATLIPNSLRMAIARWHPRSVLVRESDYDSETIASELQHRDGNRCLGAATADVNGDRRNDFVLLVPTKSGDGFVVAALSTPDSAWRLFTLDNFGEDTTPRQYIVSALKPGTYRDMYDDDHAPDEWKPEPGRVRRYASRRSGFSAAKLDSAEVAYFYTGTRWVHLWLSD